MPGMEHDRNNNIEHVQRTDANTHETRSNTFMLALPIQRGPPIRRQQHARIHTTSIICQELAATREQHIHKTDCVHAPLFRASLNDVAYGCSQTALSHSRSRLWRFAPTSGTSGARSVTGTQHILKTDGLHAMCSITHRRHLHTVIDTAGLFTQHLEWRRSAPTSGTSRAHAAT